MRVSSTLLSAFLLLLAVIGTYQEIMSSINSHKETLCWQLELLAEQPVVQTALALLDKLQLLAN
jgi:hypothetical protein